MPDPAPNPPRFRWLRRLALLAVLCIVGLTLLRVYWGHREQSEHDRAVAAARDKGYPVLFTDLSPAQLSPQDNRATYIYAALQSVPYINAQGQFIDDTDWYDEGGTDYFDEHRLPDPVTDNADYLAQFQPVLDAVRLAQVRTRSDWTQGQPISQPAFNLMLPQLGECRRLARLIEDATQRALAEQDYPAVLAMLGDLLTISDSLQDDPYVLINHLVVVSIRSMAASAVQDALPQLPNDPALSGHLETLNKRWLDEHWAEHGLPKAYQCELWWVYDGVEGMIDGRYSYSSLYGYTPDHLAPLEFAPSRWLLQPYYQSDLAFIVRYFTALIDAADGCTNLQEFEDRLDRSGVTAMGEGLDTAAYRLPLEFPLSHEALWAFDSAARSHFRFLATARMCATAIAIKRYRIDHGHPPERLTDLVPDYLDAVPDDPFVLGRPITYLPDGASPVTNDGNIHTSPLLTVDTEVRRRAALAYPLLYCVGSDRNDDGGLFPIDDEDGTLRGWLQGPDNPTDWCFFLTQLPVPIPDPTATPFNQRNPYGGGHGLGRRGGRTNNSSGPANPQPPAQGDNHDADPGSTGEEEQVDEQGTRGQSGEHEDRPQEPEQREP